MENNRLEPLTEIEKRQVEEHHGLVYSFLHRHGYSIEQFYNIVIFGYLKAIQTYNRRKDLQEKYQLAFICEQYMRAEVKDHFKTENAKKRKPSETVVSLDAEYSGTENLYNCVCDIGGKSPELEILETEQLMEFLNGLSDAQRKITEMKLDGYNNKEIYSALEMKSSTFYMEVQRLKKALAEMIG